MTELAEWDRYRFNLSQAGLDFEESSPINDFIDDGALCYSRSLQVLHGELLHSTPRDTKKWMKFSRKARKKIAKDYPGLIEGRKDIEITDEFRDHVNRRHPDRSYTALGETETRDVAKPLDWSLPEERDAALNFAEESPADDEPIGGTDTILADLERKYGTADTGGDD